MVAKDEGSCHMCAIAISAGNVEVCKVIRYKCCFVIYTTCIIYPSCMYRLLIVALGVFLACQVVILMAICLAMMATQSECKQL